jgi:hypothetical protein
MAYKDPEAARRYADAYRQKNRVKNAEYKRKWYKKNKARVLGYLINQADNRKSWHERQQSAEVNKYHRAQHLRLREELLGRPKPEICEACGSSGRIVFDHCHKRGYARGWLCDPCNRALGCVEDEPERLLKLIAYLKRMKVHVSPQLNLPGV